MNNKCPECDGEIIDTGFEKTCKECGLVLSDFASKASYVFSERNINGNTSKQYVALGKRADFVGALGSFIDYEKSNYLRDNQGRILKPKEQKLYRRLKSNYSKFIRIKNNETEYRIFKILTKVSRYLNLNKAIQKDAAYFYRKIKKNEKKVINNISLIAFCIFFAARKENHNAPITIKEISETFNNYGHRVNARLILRDAIRYKKHLKKNLKHHTSEDYLTRLLNGVKNYEHLEKRLKKKGFKGKKVEYLNHLRIKCQLILKNLNKWQRGGRNPFILTGAVIYLADRLVAKELSHRSVLTQKIVSLTTGIAEYSIRDHYVNLLKPLFINIK
ncbi:MAG: hypothetical protein R6U96_12015 [Promethearchaeia archaeon]